MTAGSSPETVRPPVALGCFFAMAVVVAFVGIVMFGVVFLESGANTGELRLESAEAYAPGSVEFIAEENIYLARLFDDSFVALSDLDAANRANQGRRCRVMLLATDDSSLGITPASLASQMSPEAVGATSVLAESCLGSVYDIAGVRLNGPGANLDRYAVSVDSGGRVVIDTSERQCSRRTLGATSAPGAC